MRRLIFKARVFWWLTRYKVRIWRLQLRWKIAVGVFKLKRWDAARKNKPIRYVTRWRKPGSLVVMHNRHRDIEYTVYRVMNWAGTLRRVYP